MIPVGSIFSNNFLNNIKYLAVIPLTKTVNAVNVPYRQNKDPPLCQQKHN